MTRSPHLNDVLSSALDSATADLCVCLPGIVKSYDASTQVADVQIALKKTFVDANGDTQTEDYPVIPSVPVIWPRGGGYFLTFPLAAGNGCTLVFADKDPAAWRVRGEVADPGDAGVHGLSGALCYPGLEIQSRALTNADAGTGHAVIGKEGGTQIHIDSGGVKIGSVTASHPVPLGDMLLSYLNSHVHTSGGAGSPTSPPTVPATSAINSTKHMVDG